MDKVLRDGKMAHEKVHALEPACHVYPSLPRWMILSLSVGQPISQRSSPSSLSTLEAVSSTSPSTQTRPSHTVLLSNLQKVHQIKNVNSILLQIVRVFMSHGCMLIMGTLLQTNRLGATVWVIPLPVLQCLDRLSMSS